MASTWIRYDKMLVGICHLDNFSLAGYFMDGRYLASRPSLGSMNVLLGKFNVGSSMAIMT